VWKKSTRSGSTSNCIELAAAGAVRDSKNPTGPALHVDLIPMLVAIKAGNFDQ
jgi:hypothetical protein